MAVVQNKIGTSKKSVYYFKIFDMSGLDHLIDDCVIGMFEEERQTTDTGRKFSENCDFATCSNCKMKIF